jgi:hypothetical protein
MSSVARDRDAKDLAASAFGFPGDREVNCGGLGLRAAAINGVNVRFTGVASLATTFPDNSARRSSGATALGWTELGRSGSERGEKGSAADWMVALGFAGCVFSTSCATAREPIAVGDEVDAVETDLCANSRPSRVEGFSTSSSASNGTRGFGVEKIDPTIGWIAPLVFRTLKAIR